MESITTFLVSQMLVLATLCGLYLLDEGERRACGRA